MNHRSDPVFQYQSYPTLIQSNSGETKIMVNQSFNISLPDGVNAIDNPITDDRITLPFEVAFLNWHNGEARIKPEVGCGVLHFGGWWASAEEAESLSGPLPEKFVPETWTNKEGLDY